MEIHVQIDNTMPDSRPSMLAFATMVLITAFAAPASAQEKPSNRSSAVGQTPVCAPTTGVGNPSVLTGQYDNYRDAHNGDETCLYATALKTGAVTLAEASYSPLLVDTPPTSTGLAGNNPIYAQPLYVAGITVQHPVKGTCSPCNMVILATAFGSIFAYNADNGNLLWKRSGTGGKPGTNSLWADDCGATGGVIGGVPGKAAPYIGPGLPFAGIVSTPVIDATPVSPYTYTMFVTSACQTAAPLVEEWWLHEIDLTGQASGADVAGQDISTIQIKPSAGGATMNVPNQLQRPALLEVKVPGATPNPLIYVAFGVAGVEDNETSYPYHGWLLGYTVESNGALAPTPALTFSTTPTGCGVGGGTTQCPSGNGGAPACDCLQPSGFQNAPNWGGLGGGIWMSGKGPASRTDGSNVAHTFVATANGGFQVGSASNWGDSILDFHLSQAAGMPTTPSDYFTPSGGPGDCWITNTCAPVLQPPLLLSSCAYDTPGDGTCNRTVEFFNEYDWDMGVSGIALFDFGSSEHYAVTVDKGGYGYLLQQDQLQGFKAGDPGNIFPFAALDTLCTGAAHTCHRVTSLAFYNNTLYLWPYEENLKSLQFNLTPITPAGSPAIYTDTTGGTVTGPGCATGSCPCSGGSCFTHTVIPGDQLIANGCSGSSCPVITGVASDTELTVSPPFSQAIPKTKPVPYTYSGYFVNPVRDTNPEGSEVGYPGGSLVVTSNGIETGTGVVWALIGDNSSQETGVGSGYAEAYDAVGLEKVWSTYGIASFELSRFAMPTVARGLLFVPTYNITASKTNPNCTSAAPCVGALVYQGAAN